MSTEVGAGRREEMIEVRERPPLHDRRGQQGLLGSLSLEQRRGPSSRWLAGVEGTDLI